MLICVGYYYLVSPCNNSKEKHESDQEHGRTRKAQARAEVQAKALSNQLTSAMTRLDLLVNTGLVPPYHAGHAQSLCLARVRMPACTHAHPSMHARTVIPRCAHINVHANNTHTHTHIHAHIHAHAC